MLLEWIKNFGDGYGLDLVIDAAGVSASLKLALDIVRPAGQITKVGWGPQPLNFSLDHARPESGQTSGQLFAQLADLGESDFSSG